MKLNKKQRRQKRLKARANQERIAAAHEEMLLDHRRHHDHEIAEKLYARTRKKEEKGE